MNPIKTSRFHNYYNPLGQTPDFNPFGRDYESDFNNPEKRAPNHQPSGDLYFNNDPAFDGKVFPGNRRIKLSFRNRISTLPFRGYED